MPSLKVGDIVTKQPKSWFDGKPVNGWPRFDMTGELLEFVDCKHTSVPFARVEWQSGRKSLEAQSDLIFVCDDQEPFRNGPDTDF